MAMKLLAKEALAISAVVPQCLDVHFIRDSDFDFMVRGKRVRGYHDGDVQLRRSRAAHFEYRRSLIYARQIVVNRAYLYNPLVYDDFNNSSSGLDAFAKLLEEEAIVVYLSGRNLLDDEGTLKPLPSGRAAVAHLVDNVEDISFVRLAIDDDQNEQQIAKLATSFRMFCSGLSQIAREPVLLQPLVAEVFQRQLEHHEWDAFAASLEKISDWAVHAQDVNRTTLYHKFFMQPHTQHHDGWFKSPKQNPFLLSQKKVIDLKYNANLPDALRRFVLTPLGLPTRSAIRYFDTDLAADDEERLWLEDLQNHARTTFYSAFQGAFYFPHLDDLTIEDVWEIRRFPEWQRFIELQDLILASPLKALEHLEALAGALGDFQRELGRWYVKKYPSGRATLLTAAVGIAIKAAGAVFSAWANKEMVARGIPTDVASTIQKGARGWVAELVIEFRDENGLLRRDLSHSIELLKRTQVLTKEDLADLFHDFGATLLQPSNSGGE